MRRSEDSKKTIHKLNCFFLICGIIMAASEIWKQWCLTFRVNHCAYDWWYFPFQLCSMAMYALLILPWVKKQRIRTLLLSFLMNYSLLGGIAVFADTSGLHYPIPALTAHSYLWHILLITIGIAAGITRLIETEFSTLSYRDLKDSTFLYLGCCVIAGAVNQLFGFYGMINMFYINPDFEMQQVGFAALVPVIGNVPTIVVYILATMLGAAILFHIWRLTACSYQHFKKKNSTV